MGPLGSIRGPQGDNDSVLEIGSGSEGWGRAHQVGCESAGLGASGASAGPRV